MKRTAIFSTIALSSILVLSSCEKEEFVYIPSEPQIEITDSDIIFDANGGTGTVSFNAKGSCSASCTSNWCTASVSGSTLTVIAEPNTSLDGRAAAIVITCNGQETKVTAQQTGMVFSYLDANYIVEMQGGEFVINGKSSFATTYESDDWIKVDELLGNYIVTIDANDSGDKRTGILKITAGDITTTYTFVQKFERNFAGTYQMLRYTSSSESTLEKTTVTLTRDAEDLDLYHIEGWNGLKIPIHYDVTRNQLYIKNAECLGQHTDGNWLYICKNFVNSSGSSYLSYNATSDAYYTWFDFKYEGGKYSILFNNTPPSSSYAESTGFTIYTFSVSPDSGTAIASANRVASQYVVRRPKFIQP